MLDYLVAHGVGKERLVSKGFSSSAPVATNRTEVGREQNRRVEFIVHFVIFATAGEDGRAMHGPAVFTLSLPRVLPPLVVVQPGVSVVRDLDQEVFYADGYYWVRQEGTWYRTHDHRRGWARVEPRSVPAPIVRSPPGRYRRYRGEEHRGGDRDHRGGHGRDRDEHGRDRD